MFIMMMMNILLSVEKYDTCVHLIDFLSGNLNTIETKKE